MEAYQPRKAVTKMPDNKLTDVPENNVGKMTDLQAEIEGLVNVENILLQNIEKLKKDKETIKAEAYNECIEKVKALFPSDNEPYQYWEIHEGADNLLKELVNNDGQT